MELPDRIVVENIPSVIDGPFFSPIYPGEPISVTIDLTLPVDIGGQCVVIIPERRKSDEQRKKIQKEKGTGKKVKEKMAVRRAALHEHRKEQRAEELRLQAEFELKNGKPEPILNDPEAILRREEKEKGQCRRPPQEEPCYIGGSRSGIRSGANSATES
jgi:hypothetical protein